MSSQMDEREVARVGNAIREALQLPATVQNAALGRIAARAAIEATRPPVVTDEVVERLMREFYLSRDYNPKAARPADNVKAAIAFALASMPAVVSGGGE